jgi:hypothetical protein
MTAQKENAQARDLGVSETTDGKKQHTPPTDDLASARYVCCWSTSSGRCIPYRRYASYRGALARLLRAQGLHVHVEAGE